MKVSEIKKRYKELKQTILKVLPNTDFTEYDLFFDSLQRFNKYEVHDLSSVIESLYKKDAKKNKGIEKNHYALMSADEIMQACYSLSDITFDSMELATIEKMEQDNYLTKKHLLELAKKIGITKEVFKSKKEIYQEMKRTINNRDVLVEIEKTVKSSS